MHFKKVELEDYKKIQPYFDNQPYLMCDYSFGALYMWRDLYQTEFAIENDVLYIKYVEPEDKREDFAYPLFLGEHTKEQEKKAIRRMQEITCRCKENCERLVLACVPDEALKFLADNFKIKEMTVERMWADYIYSYEEIFTLAGRKFSSKRNHKKNFERSYPNSELRPITKENLDDVIAFYEELARKEAEARAEQESSENLGSQESQKDKPDKIYIKQDEQMTKMEEEETLITLRNVLKLPGQGAALYVGDKIVGFTLGEKVADTLIIHVEKADVGYKGAYTKLFHEYVLMHEGQDIKYINREEDLGDLGLRKSKMSYQPIKLVGKNAVVFEKCDMAANKKHDHKQIIRQ